MRKRKRSLYDCLEARAKDDRIRCAKGHILSSTRVSILRLIVGKPMDYTVCQNCPDFNPHDGEPVSELDKGWKHLISVEEIRELRKKYP